MESGIEYFTLSCQPAPTSANLAGIGIVRHMGSNRAAVGPGQAHRFPAGLVIGLTMIRRFLVTAGHALRDAAVAKPTPIAVRRGEARWTRRAVLVGAAAVVLAVWSLFTSIADHPLASTGGILTMAVIAVSMIAVLACHRWPLYGLRLMVVLLFGYTYTVVHSWNQPEYFGESGWLGLVPFWLLLAALVTVFAVAESAPLPVTIAADVLVIFAITWSRWYFADSTFWGSAWVGSTAGLVGAVTLVGYVVQLARTGNEQRLHRATALADTAILAERAHIARELHDVVAHHMSMLALRADSAPYRFPDLSDDVRAEFAALCSTAREGLTEMRRLLGVLRADGEAAETAPQPALREIKDLVDGLRAAGTDIGLSLYVIADELPTALGLSAYRIAQEALSNAIRHAPGSAIRVEVWTTDSALHLDIRNTEGTEPAAPQQTDEVRARHGLLGMLERVNMLGGRLETGPAEDGGFRVLAELPLHEELDQA
jgi:signal transduction histidine kinase